jgi:CubicO group peptidase (beta-lactamase class C family)
VFRYSSAATYMCSAIVQRVTGMRMVEYLRPRLFEPLGIEQFHWETCPQGIDVGGWGLSLQTESLARFGQLCLQGGVWNGRQLVPASWVAEATSRAGAAAAAGAPDAPARAQRLAQGYGYQFWRCTNGAYRGDGAFGQFTVVMPRQGAVLALHSELRRHAGRARPRLAAPAAGHGRRAPARGPCRAGPAAAGAREPWRCRCPAGSPPPPWRPQGLPGGPFASRPTALGLEFGGLRLRA